MLNKVRTVLVGLSLFVLVGLLGMYLYVQMGRGDELFGDGKGALQPTSFETLVYPADQPGHLLCPATLCVKAEVDGIASDINMSTTQLRQKIADFADSMPTIRIHQFDIRKNQFEFLERMPGQHLPAVVSIRILPGTQYTSKVAIYSYQPLGDSTEEDHRERVERWLNHVSK